MSIGVAEKDGVGVVWCDGGAKEQASKWRKKGYKVVFEALAYEVQPKHRKEAWRLAGLSEGVVAVQDAQEAKKRILDGLDKGGWSLGWNSYTADRWSDMKGDEQILVDIGWTPKFWVWQELPEPILARVRASRDKWWPSYHNLDEWFEARRKVEYCRVRIERIWSGEGYLTKRWRIKPL